MSLIKEYFTPVSLDEDMIEELLPTFVEEVEEDMQKLIECFNENETDGVKKRVHKIKGVAKCYGAHSLVEKSEKIEACIEEKSSELIELIEELRQEVMSLKASWLKIQQQ